MQKTRKTLGLALGSGGVKGFFHLGVLKTFTKHGIPIDYIAGASIGAWIGSHYAMFQDVAKLEELTFGKKKEKFFVFLEPVLGGGFVKGDKLEKLIDEWLSHANFSDTKIPFTAVATDLNSGEGVIFNKGKLAPAVRASMSIPSVFKPMEYNGKFLVDGGLVDPVPDDLVKKMGADIVVAVNLDSYHPRAQFNSKNLSLYKITTQSFDIVRSRLAEYSINDADVVIELKTCTRGLSSWRQYFTGDKMGQELVRLGEIETEKHISKIKNLLK